MPQTLPFVKFERRPRGDIFHTNNRWGILVKYIKIPIVRVDGKAFNAVRVNGPTRSRLHHFKGDADTL